MTTSSSFSLFSSYYSDSRGFFFGISISSLSFIHLPTSFVSSNTANFFPLAACAYSEMADEVLSAALVR